MTNNKQESHLIRILDKLVKNAFSELKRYFNVMPDKESEEDTIRNINNGVSFHGANLWVLVFAIFIASLGLNVNSTAVIIGRHAHISAYGTDNRDGYGCGNQ